MKIDFINPPFVFTNTGERIEIANIKGVPSKGATLSKINDELYEVVGNSNDSDCVGGGCPIK